MSDPQPVQQPQPSGLPGFPNPPLLSRQRLCLQQCCLGSSGPSKWFPKMKPEVVCVNSADVSGGFQGPHPTGGDSAGRGGDLAHG